jgi:hypothetical protein
MVLQTAFQLTLDFLTSKPVVVVPSAEQVSSDAGLLPFRQLDERIELTRQFAEALTDRRNAGYVDHSLCHPQTSGCGGKGGLCPLPGTPPKYPTHACPLPPTTG